MGQKLKGVWGMRKLIITTVCVSFMGVATSEDGPEQPIPDLTKREELTRINERWVGPLGIYCGAWRPRQRSDEAKWVRQLLVQEVEEGSPADGVLQVGDVILGASGTGAKEVPLFEGAPWAMIPIAEAITEAEAHDPALLKLRIFRFISEGKTKEDPDAVKGPSIDDLDIDALEPAGGADPLKDLGLSPNKEPGTDAEPKLVGKEMIVTIELDALGRYSETAPFDCNKSRNILNQGIDALLKEEKGDKAGFSVLCLLAAAHPDDPRHDAIMSKAGEWAHALEPEGSPWFVGPKLMALSEYYMKSRDESIFPKLEALAEYHALRVSWFGTCGHRYSEPQPDGSPNGRIAGYGPITCSGALGFLGLSLAREAGVESEAVEKSYRAQRAFFGHYAPRSGMGYGEMPYGLSSGGDYNGKCSMSGLALALEDGQEEKAKFFARVATLSSSDIRKYAHGGSYFGQVFHPIGAALGGAKAANMQFREVLWHMELKRRWDYRWIYDSSGNGYNDFEHAAAALIFYAAPLKQLVITGRDRKGSLELTDEEFEEMVKVKSFDGSETSHAELIAALPTAQGFMRGPVADELARRLKDSPEAPETSDTIDRLLAMAGDTKAGVFGRTGACFALMKIKDRSGEPLASLKNAEIAEGMVQLLKDPDPYIRFAGVRALQRLDSATVRAHADAIMDAIAATGRPTFPLDEEDPLQWAHGEMGDLLVRNALKDGLDGVNRDKLIPAIRSLLQTPNGGARGASSMILTSLNKEETLAVSDLLVDNIRVSPPGNAMGGKGSTLNSQKALAAHYFEEAISLSVNYGPAEAIKSKVPQQFGRAALGMSSARKVMQTAGEQMLVNAVDARELVEGILKGEAPTELSSLKRIESVSAADPVLKLPAATTELTVEASNFAAPGEGQTTYTWRKLYGAGKVSFSPNGSGQSKTSTATFIDKKPGKYCFEVEMTDELGLTVVRDNVIVTLNDASGKLPRNQAPQAQSQTLAAMPGFPLPVTFSGSDPDGDHLGYTVTELPSRGVLTAADGRLIEAMAAVDGPITYTADFGYEGTDELAFYALDGQGERAKGTIAFQVSAAKVPVVLYEGFEYPHGGVHGKEGGSSFGFDGPWMNSRGTDQNYRVHRASIENPGENLSVNYPNMPSRGGRLTGGGHTTVSRLLDTKLLAKHGLFEPGGELWFSAYADGWDVRFSFVGPNIDFGFSVTSKQMRVLTMLNGEQVGEDHQTWSHSAGVRFAENEPMMIVGHCVWGKTEEEPDTLSIHRVYNAPVFGPMLIEKPAAVMREPIDQEKLNSILLNLSEKRAIDEIRIGTSPASVLQGTVPMP